MEHEVLSVSELNAFVNQTLQFAYPLITVQGEVSSYKVNQGKWVFFDLKDEESTISCFMPIFQLKVALADGMVIKATSTPNLTKWGRFSLTVKAVELAGEGSVKKAFEMLKARFEAEGLFAPERKRPLPDYPRRIALITSKQAAAYNDFMTVAEQRWRGLDIVQAQVQVQGLDAPAQIVRAVEYFNRQHSDYDILVVIRGGGSAEDLQAFNNEDVVRAVYGSKIPTVVGIGHEDDVSLAELAADVRAATPTDAARRITPESSEVLASLDHKLHRMHSSLLTRIEQKLRAIERVNQSFSRLYNNLEVRLEQNVVRMQHGVEQALVRNRELLAYRVRTIASLDPRAILSRGYSIATVNGRVLKQADGVGADADIMLQLHQGSLIVRKADGGRDDGKENSGPQQQQLGV